LHVEQTPERALLSVIGACGVARRRPDAAILFLDKLFVAQAFGATITPFVAHSLVQALGEGFREAVGDGFRHDGVVVVMLSSEPIAQLLQTDTAGYRKPTDVIAKPGLLRSDEVCQRAAWLASLFVRLLAKEMESVEHFRPAAICVQLHVIAHSIGWKKSIHAARFDQVLLNDEIEELIGFGVVWAGLCATVPVRKDARINALQPPGVKERLPVDELTKCRKGKILGRAHADERRRRDIFRPPLDRSSPGAR